MFTATLTIALAPSLVGCQKKHSTPAASSGTGASPASGSKVRPSDDAPLVDAPTPPPVTTNPLSGAKLFVDPESLAMLQSRRLASTDPAKAEIVGKIAQQPQGLWMGEWNSDIFRAVEHYVKRARADGSVPTIIAYNIPHRDCGQYSAGGISSADAYRRWIRSVAAGIGQDPVVVILEPDAIGHFQECLSDAQKAERMMLLHDAVKVLRQSPNTA
ncbi:MAG TPA: glycoside hydrolase family 6 protein, partial [Polyangiaceae bacterium]|nr:glycoside hydrolase family 6 protein [Polyangiaceae bacterium]